MNYFNEQIKNKLSTICYENKKNGKLFYSLNDIFKEFKLKDYQLAFRSIQELKHELINLSYPLKNVFQYKKEGNKVYDVFLSQQGLLFVFAKLAKSLNTEHERNLCYEIAKASYKKDFMFYPESRLLLRADYIETTKSLRSRVKQIYKDDDYISISERLNKLYHTIICAYYLVDNSEHLCMYKFNNPKKKYLDYISVRELRDLQDIQNTMLYNLTNNKSTNYLQTAIYEATKKRKAFIADYGISPLNYTTHTNTPVKMIKQFISFRDKLKISEQDLVNNIDELEK